MVREAVVPALKDAGFDVTIAESGDVALSIMETGKTFNVVFSDIVMPGSISGIDLAKIITERFPSVRMVLTTGYTDKRVTLPGVSTLAKPYDVSDAVQLLTGHAYTVDLAGGR